MGLDWIKGASHILTCSRHLRHFRRFSEGMIKALFVVKRRLHEAFLKGLLPCSCPSSELLLTGNALSHGHLHSPLDFVIYRHSLLISPSGQ